MLYANFDQVWTLLFEPAKNRVWKPDDRAGLRVDDLQGQYEKRLCRYRLQKATGVEITEPNFETKPAWELTQAGQLKTTSANDKISLICVTPLWK